jgi:cytochrome c oxidase cbb3-type subunit 4
MDINLIRSLLTVAALAAFLGIVWWAYSPARKERLEQAGRSILEEQEP